MKKILVGSWLEQESNGDMAVITSVLKAVRQTLPDAKLTIMIADPAVTRERYDHLVREYGVEFIAIPWFHGSSSRVATLVGSGLSALKSTVTRRKFLRSFDLYLELGTDTHTDYYGSIALYSCLYPLVLCIAAGVPVALLGQSGGPFQSRLAKWVAGAIYRRAGLITMRDQISDGYLKQLGVTGTRLVADWAFLMEPAPPERIDRILSEAGVDPAGGPLMGLSASQRIHTYAFAGSGFSEVERKVQYVRLMAGLADYLVEKYGATVVLVSHDNAPRRPDVDISREIHGQVKSRERVVVLKSTCRTDELKGIISRCEVFLGCRMHATIAATSTHVPTIAISYGHKFHGVLAGVLKPGEEIVDIGAFGPDELFDELVMRTQHTWEHRKEIRTRLLTDMPGVRERAFLNARILGEFLDRGAGAVRAASPAASPAGPGAPKGR